jgi:C4-dicarboxylate transporter DctM subunit
MVMPIIILGGIYSGFFTPTEAAAVSCLYAIFIGGVIYRGFTRSSFLQAFSYTFKLSAILYIIFAGVSLFTYVISVAGWPAALAEAVVSIGLGPREFVMLLSLVSIILGFFSTPWGQMFYLLPVIMPTFIALDISLLWWGVLFCMSCMVGEMTPPMAVGLYFTAKVANRPPEVVVRGVIPFVITEIVAMLVLIFFPEIALWLPRAMGLTIL